MDKRKMLRLCDELTKANVVYESEEHGRNEDPSRNAIVERWMWTAIMLLDYLGYDVVKRP